MNLQESGEMYLETILVLQKSQPQVRSIDIANHLGYSKPSVSRAVNLLKDNEYISIDSSGHITLLPKGAEIANCIYERHTILTAFLTKIGVSAKAAAEDACKIEHIISKETFNKIKDHMQ
ncbi:Transcriptional regulator MntR [bioreactor metagenome]|uniref:Transcriptional regulator MntR n=1 Tax=bioreactor metagenome TaxID=1076179 RepID=A0A645GVE7_9ZZZZ